MTPARRNHRKRTLCNVYDAPCAFVACWDHDVMPAGAKRRMTRVMVFIFVPLALLALTLIAHSDGHAQTASNDPEAIPLKVQRGTFVLPVLINGQITLNFTVDSGATYVSIPADVVSVLVRTGTLQKSDFIGQEDFQLADGSIKPSATFSIRSLKVGNHVLENVKASVADAKAELLLGQSFLSRFNSWSIDNQRQVLLLNQPPDKPMSAPQADTPKPQTASPGLTNSPCLVCGPSQDANFPSDFSCWTWSARYQRWIYSCAQPLVRKQR